MADDEDEGLSTDAPGGATSSGGDTGLSTKLQQLLMTERAAHQETMNDLQVERAAHQFMLSACFPKTMDAVGQNEEKENILSCITHKVANHSIKIVSGVLAATRSCNSPITT